MSRPGGAFGTGWIAVVAIKPVGRRKTRLAAHLPEPALTALTEQIAAHVLATLGACGELDEVLLLADRPPSSLGVGWVADKGYGLNAELERVREQRPKVGLLVIHADLPRLAAADVAPMIEAAEHDGAAMAPDRHERGTNALALRAGLPFRFAFGPDSFARHLAQHLQAAVIRRPGLAFDIDTPEDLAALERVEG